MMNAVPEDVVGPPKLFGLPATTIALFVLFLAAMDAIATVWVLRQQLGTELNPVMAWLVSHGEATFVLFKLLLTALCVRWMVLRAHHPYARVAALVGLSIYLPVVALHIVNNITLGLI
ncbi:MAG: DUF5658 family protein [Planctomycetota bacterium]|jgi:hypothetical protein